MEQDRIQRYNA